MINMFTRIAAFKNIILKLSYNLKQPPCRFGNCDDIYLQASSSSVTPSPS